MISKAADLNYEVNCTELSRSISLPWLQHTESIVAEPEKPKSPCSPNPCGANTNHEVAGNNCICTCLPGYRGDPTRGCRPECVSSSECDRDKACINLKCADPCSDGICGRNADCMVTNHVPQCKCKVGFTGNPFEECIPTQPSKIFENEILIHWIKIKSLAIIFFNF